MFTMKNLEFEILEEYELLGERRFRVRIKGTKIVLNVSAESNEEAIRKAKELVKKIKLDEVIDQYRIR